MGTGDMDVEGFLMVSLVGSTSKIPASVTCMLVLLPRRSPILGAIDLAIVIPLNTLIPYQLYYTESSGLTATLVSRSVLIIHALSFRVTRNTMRRTYTLTNFLQKCCSGLKPTRLHSPSILYAVFSWSWSTPVVNKCVEVKLTCYVSAAFGSGSVHHLLLFSALGK